MIAINEFANDQKYAIVKKRIKINKKKILRKAILRCDRERNDKLQKFERRKIFNRSCECSFEAVIILQFEKWNFTIKNVAHNHLFDERATHRKLTMFEKVKQQIALQTRMKIAFRHIFNNFRVNFDDDEIIKDKNVYNQKARFKKKTLKNLTATKVLFHEIYSRDFWFVKYYFEIEVEELKKLFFAYFNHMMTMICNWEILFIDIIYKINQYRMFLCVITKIIALNITFFVEFAFILNENSIIYEWILEQIVEL